MAKPTRAPSNLAVDDFGLVLMNMKDSIEAFNMYCEELGASEIKDRMRKKRVNSAYWRGWNDAYKEAKRNHPRVKWEEE